MKVRLSADLLSGLMFAALGLFALIYGSQYPLGVASRMGAGYFPRVISICLISIGLILVVRSLRATPISMESIGIRPLAFVLLGTLAFGLLIERAGFLVAGAVLVVIARLSSRDFSVFEVAVLATLLVLILAGLFNYLLGLPIPLLPRW